MGTGKAVPLLAAALMLAGLQPRTAMADGPGPDKMACIAADTDGQSLRMTGNLLRARKRFAFCASTSCPSLVRDDCLQRIAEVEAAQPTVVFTATNGMGRPVVSVRVTVDGVVAADSLDGRPLRVDPGEHEFLFEALGRISTQMTLTLHEGDKRVRHAVVLRTGSGDPADLVPVPEPAPAAEDVGPAEASVVAPAAAPSQAPTGSGEPQGATLRAGPRVGDALSTRRVAAIAAGGAGVLGVLLGSVFGALTIQGWSDATANCPRNVCPANSVGTQSQREAHDAARDGDISTVAFIVGGVGLAAGAWLWFAPAESSAPKAGVSLLPVAGPSQGQLLVHGRF